MKKDIYLYIYQQEQVSCDIIFLYQKGGMPYESYHEAFICNFLSRM